jgi:hypothetical protein
MATLEEINNILSPHDIHIGISQEKENIGTWEWFERKNRYYGSDFGTAEAAYVAAAMHVLETSGDELPKLDEDGEFDSLELALLISAA